MSQSIEQSTSRPASFGLLTVLALLAFGCSREGHSSSAPTGYFRSELGPTHMTLIAPGHPRIHVESRTVVDRLESRRPLAIQANCELRFQALGSRDLPPEARLRCFLSHGDEEIELAKVQLDRIGSAELRGDAQLPTLGDENRLSLDQYRGRSVRFGWELVDAPQGGSVELVQPRVVALDPRSDDAPARPSILLICSDTHRFDYALGDEGRLHMPSMQPFFDSSVRYERAYSTASWTLPSISSMLSGLHPAFHATGRRTRIPVVEGQEVEAPAGSFRFGNPVAGEHIFLTAWPAELETIGERLQRAGYRTRTVLSNPLYLLSGLFADGTQVAIDSGVKPGEEITRLAIELMNLPTDDAPLFLLAHYMDVHQWQPWVHTKRALENEPAAVRESYAEMVRQTDVAIRRLVDEWDAHFGAGQSLVIFTSDHGESLMDGESRGIGHGNSLHEALLHVPLAIRYPDGLGPAPGTALGVASTIDLLPTLLEVAGVPIPPDTEGRSLLWPAELTDRVLHTDYQLYSDELSSVRSGGDKLILNLTKRTSRVEALEAGTPLEGASERLEALYRDYMETARARTATLSSEHRVDDGTAREGLEALGYIGEE